MSYVSWIPVSNIDISSCVVILGILLLAIASRVMFMAVVPVCNLLSVLFTGGSAECKQATRAGASTEA